MQKSSLKTLKLHDGIEPLGRLIHHKVGRAFIKLSVCGYNIVCTHGDLDSIKNLGVVVNTIFTKKYGQTIDYTISADKHHSEEFESFDIENILVRSLCGTEDFANSKRLYSRAGQTLMFFTPEDGRETVCNIKLE